MYKKKYYLYKKNAGSSLIELILYIALVSIFLSGAILFAWDVIYGRVKSEVRQEVTANLLFVSQRITTEVRNASGIVSLTPTRITLSSDIPANNPTVIEFSANKITLGRGNSGDCPTTNPCDLTGSNVSVSDATFTDLSVAPSSLNISFSITIESTADRKEWQVSDTINSSVEIRSQ